VGEERLRAVTARACKRCMTRLRSRLALSEKPRRRG
jgi:hypothetical protein